MLIILSYVCSLMIIFVLVFRYCVHMTAPALDSEHSITIHDPHLTGNLLILRWTRADVSCEAKDTINPAK